MIKIENLKKSYNKKFKLEIQELKINNEIVGLVGNNGAGKTTFLNLLLNLVDSDKGTILIKDKNIKDEVWKEITGSYIDESFLIPFLTVEEYFEFLANIRKVNKTELLQGYELYKDFFNNEILNQTKFINSFSKGNKLKIGIFSALFFNPSICILDEPFEGLDPYSQNVLKKIINIFYTKFNTTFIISSHNLDFVSEICNRIIVFENGKIINDLLKNEFNLLDEILKNR